MDDLPLPQEADGRNDIGVIDETKDVIVGSAGFLLGGHVLAQVGDGITSGLHGGRGEGHAAGGLRPDANGVIEFLISSMERFLVSWWTMVPIISR